VRTWRLCGGGVRTTRLRRRGKNSSWLPPRTTPRCRCRSSPSLLAARRGDRRRCRDRLRRRGDSGLDSGLASQAGILLVLHDSCQNDWLLGRMPLIERPGESSDEEASGAIFMAAGHAGDGVRGGFVWRGLLLLAVRFSVFCFTAELERLGLALGGQERTQDNGDRARQ